MINLIYIVYGIAILLFLKGAICSKNKVSALIALNSINTTVAILIIITGFLINEESYIDVAIVYLLIGYATNIGFLKKYRKAGDE